MTQEETGEVTNMNTTLLIATVPPLVTVVISVVGILQVLVCDSCTLNCSAVGEHTPLVSVLSHLLTRICTCHIFVLSHILSIEFIGGHALHLYFSHMCSQGWLRYMHVFLFVVVTHYLGSHSLILALAHALF